MLQLLIFALCMFMTTAQGPLSCFSCPTGTHLRGCHVVEKCDEGQVCSTHVSLTSGGQIYYKYKCENNQQCQFSPSAGLIGRRSSRVLCHECCQHNKCNSQLCDKHFTVPPHPHPTSHHVPQAGSVKCQICSKAENPTTCGSLRVCAKGEVCHTSVYLVNGRNMFSLQCRPHAQCAHGKREIPELEDNPPLLCHSCCSKTPGCNRHMCSEFATKAPQHPTTNHHHTHTTTHAKLKVTHNHHGTHFTTHATPKVTHSHHRTQDTTHATPKVTHNHHGTHFTTHATPKVTHNHHRTHTTTHATPKVTHNHLRTHTTTHATPKVTHNHHRTHTTTQASPKVTHNHNTTTHVTSKATHNNHRTHRTTTSRPTTPVTTTTTATTLSTTSSATSKETETTKAAITKVTTLEVFTATGKHLYDTSAAPAHPHIPTVKLTSLVQQTTMGPIDCIDIEDQTFNCTEWASHGYCLPSPGIEYETAKRRCRKHCELCQTV